MATINIPRYQGPSISLPFGAPRLNWWVLGGLAFLGFAGTLPVLQNSSVTATGFQMRRVEVQQQQIEQQIALAESDVARLTAMERVASRAREIGLEPVREAPIHLQVGVPGPEPARVPSEFLPPPAPRPETSETWWQQLRRWVSPGF